MEIVGGMGYWCGWWYGLVVVNSAAVTFWTSKFY